MNFAKSRFGARGTAMVEFTLVLPLLIGLFLGAVFFGRDIHMYNRLEESVRAGARFASAAGYNAYTPGTDPAPTACTTPPCSISFTPATGPFVTRVKNIVAYGCAPVAGATAGCTDKTVVEGVLPANVNVSLHIVNGVPRSVTVSVKNIQMVTPLGKFVLSGKPKTTFPYVGVYQAPPPG